jgi:agmatinase
MATLGEMFGAGPVETFLGLPRWEGQPVRAVVLGADCATPYASAGAYCAGGPAAIRAASGDYAANLGHVNFDLGRVGFDPAAVADGGDVPVDAGDGAANRARIGAAVARVLAARAVPVLLGGDDSLPIPMLGAWAERGPVTILQIDAHIDWRDEVQGERWGLSSTMRRASEMGHVERIVQVGSRGIGSARAVDLGDARASGVEFVTGAEVAREGIGRALSLIPAGAEVVVCLDCDALDPAVMPAVIARVPGGLGYWDVLGLIEGVAGKARIAGMAVTEFMPDRDIDGQGAALAAALVTSALGLIAGSDGGRPGEAPGSAAERARPATHGRSSTG